MRIQIQIPVIIMNAGDGKMKATEFLIVIIVMFVNIQVFVNVQVFVNIQEAMKT